MSQRKNQNSFLILTTLGVYLGLLMVGATPGIMAQHAATTRNFDVKDEIEVKDDLDKGPDGTPSDIDVAGTDQFSAFALAYSQFFIDNYKNEIEIGQEIARDLAGCKCEVLRIHKLTYFPTFEPDLKKILGTTEYKLSVSRTDTEWLSSMQIKYLPTSETFFGFGSAFSADQPEFVTKWSPAQNVVRENSFVTLQNGYLTVVTRLPRAGLATLLAKDAK